MGAVMMLTGPIGAGKTTVAQELIAIWPGPLAYIEGDRFWPILVKPAGRNRRTDFPLLIRSMTAAASPLARSGYDVLLDFSVPPQFIPVALRILKDAPLDFVMLRPPMATCAARAASRPEGRITRYDSGFYDLFEADARHMLADVDSAPKATAETILAGAAAGRFRVESAGPADPD
jgi:chloramphenicol 3-O-phosphotransferase